MKELSIEGRQDGRARFQSSAVSNTAAAQGYVCAVIKKLFHSDFPYQCLFSPDVTLASHQLNGEQQRNLSFAVKYSGKMLPLCLERKLGRVCAHNARLPSCLRFLVVDILQAHHTRTHTRKHFQRSTRLSEACRAEDTSGVRGRLLIGPRLSVTFIVLTEGGSEGDCQKLRLSPPAPQPLVSWLRVKPPRSASGGGLFGH